MSAEDWLRAMTDTELLVLVTELEERAEQFSAFVRQQVNDEVRRRRIETPTKRRW